MNIVGGAWNVALPAGLGASGTVSVVNGAGVYAFNSALSFANDAADGADPLTAALTVSADGSTETPFLVLLGSVTTVGWVRFMADVSIRGAQVTAMPSTSASPSSSHQLEVQYDTPRRSSLPALRRLRLCSAASPRRQSAASLVPLNVQSVC